MPQFRSFKWELGEENDGELILYVWAWGLFASEAYPGYYTPQRTLIKINGWFEQFYLQVPVGPNSRQIAHFAISQLPKGDNFNYEIEETLKYYDYNTTPITFIRVRTPKPRLKKWLLKRLKTIPDLAGLNLYPCEHKMSPITTFLTDKRIGHCSSFEVELYPATSRISTLRHEFSTTADSVMLYTGKIFDVPVTVGMFDIETYSDNHQAMPESLMIAHELYLISYAIQRKIVLYDQEYNKTERLEREAWVLTNRAPKCFTELIDGGYIDEKGKVHAKDIVAKIWHYNSEMEMFESFFQLIVDTDPDIFSSYNGNSYDIPYIKDRMEAIWGMSLPVMGRFSGVTTKFKDPPAWKSSAYGYNTEENWFDMPGRVSVDMMKLVKRDYKFIRYNLATVTNELLKRPKIDLSAQRQFEIYENGTLEEWELLLRYSLRDSVCLLDLYNRLDVWVASAEMANICGVGIEELYSRGQQIRMEANVYNTLKEFNMIMDRPEINEDEEYEGAIVQDPIPGYYEDVIVFDFGSLYPSNIISNNICPSTYIKPGDSVPDGVIFETIEVDGVGHRFVTSDVREGILPRLLKSFLDTRNAVKAQMETLEEGDPLYAVLNARQLAYKVSANSAYGFLGAKKGGKLPFIPGAACVTAMGRALITEVANFLKTEYNASIRYGDTDSVMVYVPGAPKDLKELMAYGKNLSKIITKHLNKKAIIINFENVYARFLVFKKKMYVAVKVSKNGEMLLKEKDISYKGVAVARREHSQWVRDIYRNVIKLIMVDRAPRQEIFNYLDEQILKMITRQVNIKDCIMVKGLGSYSADSTYAMKDYAEQELLRGRPHKPGERVQIVVKRTEPGLVQSAKMGFRYRDPDDSNADEIPLDTFFYINNNLSGPINRILSVVYGPTSDEPVPEKLAFCRKRKINIPLPPMGTPGEYRRYWFDWHLRQIIEPAVLSGTHIETWSKLLILKERICVGIREMNGEIRGREIVRAKGWPAELLG